jgi:hypothetical protein
MHQLRHHCGDDKDTGSIKAVKALRQDSFRRGRLAIAGALMAAAIGMGIAANAADANTSEKLQFNRDIRPILSENCYACHGPDKGNRKAKLRLDVREVALDIGAFKPGKPNDSELVRRIYTTNLDDQMPPPSSNKHLTSEQKETLKLWIAEGAEYQAFWAYIKPVRPEVPQIKNRAWPKNPIDSFVLSKLEANKISPAPEADKRTLLRRLSLDLIGLPPRPDEVTAFLNDNGPKAYERRVDRLLKSPHYGERMAVGWLDLARFTDTVGYHGDQNMNDFPYRDYVIDSFNKNKPFDQFTIEQLAGDLLPHPTQEQIVATGFNRLNMVTREGGAQAGEYLAKYGADRVRTVSTTWLGSTMGCCECHDHKFDPFTSKDFYSMKAFFADIKQWGVYMEYSYTPNPDLRGFSNDHPFPPEITVDSPYLRQRLDNINNNLASLKIASAAAVKGDRKEEKAFEDWRKWSRGFLKQNPSGWVVLKPQTPAAELSVPNVVMQKVINKETQKGKGLTKEKAKAKAKDKDAAPDFVVESDGAVLFNSKSKEDTDLKMPVDAGWIAAIRVELLPRKEHDGKVLMGAIKNDSAMVKLTASLKSKGTNAARKLSFYYADADHKETRYTNGYAVVGVEDGWKSSVKFEKFPQTAVYLPDEPIKAGQGDVLTVQLGKSAVGCTRISVTPFADADPLKSGNGQELAGVFSKRSRANVRQLYELYLLSARPDTKAFAEYKRLFTDALWCRDGKSPTVVTVSVNPLVTRVLARGNWQDTNGDIVPPATPHFLPLPADPDGHRLTRLDLARWLVSRDNPLTARAVMNRTWKKFFGAGISASVDDLGSQGEWPTHPELLDWLAVEFMDSGWDMKHMVKLMVMSSTYRQSSNPDPKVHEMDPANKLLASQEPRRLDAEFIRDNALAISGLLNPEIGGPSVFPYQPPGYYSNLQFPERDYSADKDDRQYRRGVYVHWQRTFLQPMLANFDAPAREECTAARNVSNSPQQALTLLNDSTFVEASRMLAGHILESARPDDDDRIDAIYERALARPAKPFERTSLETFLKLQREYYGAHPEDAKKLMGVGLAPEPETASAPELAAWTQVCRVVFGLHETITRY